MTSIDSVARLSLQNLVLSLEPPPQLSEQLPQSDHWDQSIMTVSEGAENAVKIIAVSLARGEATITSYKVSVGTFSALLTTVAW